MANASWKRSLRCSCSATLLAVGLCLPLIVQAQNNFSVIYTFSGGADGAYPIAGLTQDHAGNLYGTAALGGNFARQCWNESCGTVFRLTKENDSWRFQRLYAFSGPDGANSYTRVIFGSDGAL